MAQTTKTKCGFFFVANREKIPQKYIRLREWFGTIFHCNFELICGSVFFLIVDASFGYFSMVNGSETSKVFNERFLSFIRRTKANSIRCSKLYTIINFHWNWMAQRERRESKAKKNNCIWNELIWAVAKQLFMWVKIRETNHNQTESL